jgi:hypothetical protein
MSLGKHAATVQRQPHPDTSKDVASPRQPNRTAISKSERYREILAVLARHGIVDDELIKHEAGDRARAEHLRRACEELGTMFIKLGQMLSTRSDLLSEAYRTELAKLQDEVAPLPADAIADVIQEDLGGLPDKAGEVRTNIAAMDLFRCGRELVHARLRSGTRTRSAHGFAAR